MFYITALLWAFLILLGMAMLWILVTFAYEKKIWEKILPRRGSSDLDHVGHDNPGLVSRSLLINVDHDNAVIITICLTMLSL